MKQLLKQLVTAVPMPTSLLKLIPERFVILRYHSVHDEMATEKSYISPGIVHTTSEFRSHLRLLSEYCSVVRMSDISEHLAGATRLPKFAVAITFDDGYSDNYTEAVPLLESFGYHATFYLHVHPIIHGAMPWYCTTNRVFSLTSVPEWTDPASGRHFDLRSSQSRHEARRAANQYCATHDWTNQEEYLRSLERSLEIPSLESKDRGPMLTWDEIRDMHKRGFEVGAHTVSHPNLAKCKASLAYREIADSKAIIENELASHVDHFSYPNPILNPNFNDVTRQLVRQAGFSTAVTSQSGVVRQADNAYSLNRLWVPRTATELKWELLRAFASI